MVFKRILVAQTDKQVFTSPESIQEQARWLDLADIALHNGTSREQAVSPGGRAQEDYQELGREIRDLLKRVS